MVYNLLCFEEDCPYKKGNILKVIVIMFDATFPLFYSVLATSFVNVCSVKQVSYVTKWYISFGIYSQKFQRTNTYNQKLNTA